eukprot:jgi/Mesvir1/6994/Mv09133-RA.1
MLPSEENDQMQDWKSDEDGADMHEEEVEEEEVVEELTEEEALKFLDSAEDPLVVCRRLFTDPAAVAAQRLPPLHALSPLHISRLYEHGYVVVDGIVPDDVCAAVHNEALQAWKEGRMAHPHLKDKDDAATATRDDVIMWLHPANDDAAKGRGGSSASSSHGHCCSSSSSAGSLGPGCSAVLELMQRVQEDLRSVMRLPRGAAEYQLALYPSNRNAKYLRHRDAFPDDGSGVFQTGGDEHGLVLEKRKVTLICYGNNGWQPSHGGQLRLFKAAEHGHGSEDVAPLAGRLVVFLSGAIEHEVMLTSRERVALTAWCQ